MGRIVAIAGGDLKTTHKINQYIVALTKKENPNFLFIGTASCDAEEYISNIYDEFEPLGCSVKELNIATKRYSENEIDYLLNHADIIYVGGGDTAFMMETWKKYRLDRKLKNLYLTDQAVYQASVQVQCVGLTAGIVTVRFFGMTTLLDTVGLTDCLIFFHTFFVLTMMKELKTSMS